METVIRGHYRQGSVRGPGLRRRLEPHQRGIWLMRVAAAVPPGSSAYRAASALAAIIGDDGRLDPTKGWLAEKIGLCERTVARALVKLCRLGFLTWHRRTAITDGIEHQTSNAYQLQFPEASPPSRETTPSRDETPAQLSTLPLEGLSYDREDSISILEKGLSDTPAVVPQPTVAETFVRNAPTRLQELAQVGLAKLAKLRTAQIFASRLTRVPEKPVAEAVEPSLDAVAEPAKKAAETAVAIEAVDVAGLSNDRALARPDAAEGTGLPRRVLDAEELHVRASVSLWVRARKTGSHERDSWSQKKAIISG